VDLDSDTPSAHFLNTKNKDPRQIPLSPKAVKIIETLPGPRIGPVFKQTKWLPTPEDDGTYAPALRADSTTQAWIRARERAGEKNPALLDLRLHDHRHTAITRLVEDTDLKNVEVAAISGHKDSRQLQRYYNARADRLSEKLGWNKSAGTADAKQTDGAKVVIRKLPDGQWVASLGDIEIVAPTAKEARETLKELTD
jgi:integrase